MQEFTISPDEIVYWQWGPVVLNATIVMTWLVMILLTGIAWLSTRRLTTGITLSRRQNFMEIIIIGMRRQIREVTGQEPKTYLPFVGTLFLFIAVSNLFSVVAGFHAPTGSLSTTTALAICVFIVVPLYGIGQKGWRGYLKNYVQPTIFMLPFNIIGELSRTMALAVRLYGNIMSGTMVVGIIAATVPLFFPIFMQALGLLTGLVQAYIFAVLATVYIASATRT